MKLTCYKCHTDFLETVHPEVEKTWGFLQSFFNPCCDNPYSLCLDCKIEEMKPIPLEVV